MSWEKTMKRLKYHLPPLYFPITGISNGLLCKGRGRKVGRGGWNDNPGVGRMKICISNVCFMERRRKPFCNQNNNSLCSTIMSTYQFVKVYICMNIINLLSFASTDQINLRHLYSKNGIRELVMKDCNKKKWFTEELPDFFTEDLPEFPPPTSSRRFTRIHPSPSQKNK